MVSIFLALGFGLGFGLGLALVLALMLVLGLALGFWFGLAYAGHGPSMGRTSMAMAPRRTSGQVWANEAAASRFSASITM
jgi:hypothetical protein